MRVLTCLIDEHQYPLVLMAALMCLLSSIVTVRMLQRTIGENMRVRQHWCFLSAVTAGASVWATHFIAMIGYQPGVPVNLDGGITVLSAVIAVLGIWIGICFAMMGNKRIAVLCGGSIIGLSVAAMHYFGMFAYRAEGYVRWLPDYVAASLIASVLFSSLAVARFRAAPFAKPYVPAVLFMAGIVSLHFTGMAAFSVVPMAGLDPSIVHNQFVALAGSIALIAVLIIGMGISMERVDVRSRAQSDDRLRHLASHDVLTGLANRREFNERLQSECARLEEDVEASFALLLVDLDRFKPINDTLGHPFGDKVLEKVSERLRRAVREGDLVARIGGDEFAVILHRLSDPEAAVLLADRIVDLLSRPFIIDGELAELGASVGIALAPLDAADADSLTVRADLALYMAKREGRARSCRFDHDLSEAISERRALEGDLRRACMREDFYIVYQPVKDTLSGTFTGAEALIRWDCPKRGSVPPAKFIPVAEEMGLISRIGSAVLRQACEDAAGWEQQYTVSVNLSSVQLLDPRLPQIVAQALDESKLAPGRLELEITETALLGNDELALQSLQKLCGLGVSISLDDFGTGYSSLSYLHRFPINRIKIDKSFVQQLPSDKSSATIVRAITQLGGNLNMKITAEGIETDDQLLEISQYGCDTAQGFLIGKPIRARDVAELFLEAKNKVAA